VLLALCGTVLVVGGPLAQPAAGDPVVVEEITIGSGTSGNPFDGITKLVAWFSSLNAQFDELIAAEERRQFARQVDDIRRALYSLETDTRVLLARIPTNAPTERQRENLRGQADELMLTVQDLHHTLAEVGADFRLSEADEAEAILSDALGARRTALFILEDALAQSEEGIWDPVTIREQLTRGLQAVREAQRAVTDFRKRLS
jgi:hypothetical protein